jgi:predicted DNA-binding protein (MmcQ/YjbR family)
MLSASQWIAEATCNRQGNRGTHAPAAIGFVDTMRRVTPEQYLARLRALCRRLPDTGEEQSWGDADFTAGGRIFASLEIHKGRPCLAIATSLEEQAKLLEDPHFMRAPYTGKYGWVSALLDTEPAWTMLEALLRGAHARKLERAATHPRRKRPAQRARPKKPAAMKRTKPK